LEKCVLLRDENALALKLEESSNTDCRCSFLKTKGLNEMFKPMPSAAPVKYYYYLFKVISRGSVYSLTSSQFKAKLRADMHIEIVPLTGTEAFPSNTVAKSRIIVLGMMSKFLYYYNFLHENKYYVLRSTECLAIDFSSNSSMKTQNANASCLETPPPPPSPPPNKLVIMNECHAILDEFKHLHATITMSNQHLKLMSVKKQNRYDLDGFYLRFIYRKTPYLVPGI
jgi:hypothetical protein